MGRGDVRWSILGILAVFFAAMLAMNIVVTALPVIVGELEGTQVQYSWVVTAALLANASSTPIWGKLADMMSKKTLFQLANIIYFLSSIVAGLAPNMETIIFARVIQGIGLGGLGALAMAIMASIVSPRERGKYAGYIGAVMATATMAGPLIGGVTVDTLGWRWCFFVGIPLSVFALVLVHFKLKVPVLKRQVRIDYLGALLLVLCSSVLLVWLSFAGTPEFFAWISWESAVMVGFVVVALLLFIRVERRVHEPVIALKMFTQRTTLLAVISSASIAVCMFGMPAFLGQYYQIGKGYSPTESGMMILPLVVGNLISATVSGRLITRYGRWKIFLVMGAFILCGSMFMLSTIGYETDVRFVMGVLFCVGLGFGMQMQNLMLAVQNTVQVTRVGQATALVGFFRVLGGAAGTSILGSVMALQVSGIAVAEVNGGQTSPAYADGSGTMFLVAAFMTVAAVISNLLIKEVPLRTTI